VRWHLARTHVTGDGLALLASLPALEFLDARGTGVARAALLPLERRFALRQPQAAVLCRGAALAAAAVGGELFPCSCAAAGVSLVDADAFAAAALGAAMGGAGAAHGRTPGWAPGWRAAVVPPPPRGRACANAADWQRSRGAGGGGRGDRGAGAAEHDAIMLRGILALVAA
jgi:hypothetical protein